MDSVARSHQQLFKVLTEKCARADQADHGKILYAVLYDFRYARLHGVVGPHAECTYQHKQNRVAEAQHHRHVGNPQGLVLLSLTGVAGHQSVDCYAGTHTDGGDDLLERKRNGNRCQGVFADPGHKHGVHHIIKGLNEKRNHHGDAHGDQQPPDGHGAQLVLFCIQIIMPPM